MLHVPEVFFRKLRLRFSRSKWLIKLLHLSIIQEEEKQRGLILIQIDALSRRQLETALDSNRMPFLKKLLKNQRYKLQTHYSGMPSCTPGVQGELFYGVPTGVPSFRFYDSEKKHFLRMSHPKDAKEVEKKLQSRNEGLFKGGSCYSNVFTGGASEAHFCISDLSITQIFKRWRTFKFIAVVMLHIFSLLRVGALLIVEFFLAVIDFFRGLISGRDLWKELKFVPSRVAMCVLLREIIVIGAKVDITRGLPIVQINLMGYHDQSHRRGASSRFAHWTLKGIDRAIKRIWKSSHQTEKDYELWVYSDHGQIDTLPYELHFSETLEETVKKTLNPKDTNKPEEPKSSSVQSHISFLNRLGLKLNEIKQHTEISHKKSNIIVATLGPYVQIYLPNKTPEDIYESAKQLLKTKKIPLILMPAADGDKLYVRVLRPETEFRLPDQADEYFFDNEFIPSEILSDLINSCHHPEAGDLIISGYQGPSLPYFSFTKENGSHGGIKEEEYRGFFLRPNNCPVNAEKDYVRPTDIRNAALKILGRDVTEKTGVQIMKKTEPVRSFRVMTYNVHSCVGMDGKLSPIRIARVIEQYAPDIVALQELDVGRKRSGSDDQAKLIAEILKMKHFFHPAMTLEEEKYGDAILSRLPMRLVKADILPGNKKRPKNEPRVALWTEIDLKGKRLQFLNTHLGLNSKERQQQIESLLGPDWLGGEQFTGPAILCGDFNFTQRSRLFKRCKERFQQVYPKSGPSGTYSGRCPLIKLDHIFFTENLDLEECMTGDTHLARIASDHRPLIADFKV